MLDTLLTHGYELSQGVYYKTSPISSPVVILAVQHSKIGGRVETELSIWRLALPTS